MNIHEFKEILKTKFGFKEENSNTLSKFYGDEDIQQSQYYIIYKIKKNVVTMFTTDRIGRKRKSMKARLKSISLNDKGQIIGFKSINK